MNYDQEIADALRAALPEKFHPDIPVLARVLTAAREGSPASVATENLQAALLALQGKTLNTQSGDITVSDVSGETVAIGHGAQATSIRIYVPHTAAQKQAWRNRSHMLEKVRTYWVEGFLQQSLHKVALIELGMQYHPDALEHPWEMLVQSPDRPRTSVPPGTSIAEVFDEFGSELLILGSPGTGKTTMLLELTRTLVERAQQDETRAIPVVFNLSSWAVKRPPLDKWLIEELNARYDVPRKVAKTWIEHDQVLPLLDGLDEVAVAQRTVCVEAINIFRETHGLMGMAVCSRIADYEVLTQKLRLQGAVLLQPLTEEQIEDALQHPGSKAETVRKVLRQLRDNARQYNDQAAEELTRTPLLLSITTLAYQGDTDSDMPPPDASPAEQQRHLFATYVERMFKRRGKSEKYTPEQTKHWLAWLAKRLCENNQTVFQIEMMQLQWVFVRHQIRLYRLIIFIVLFSFMGLISSSIIRVFVMEMQRFDTQEGLLITIVTSVLISLVCAVYGSVRSVIQPIEKITWSHTTILERVIGQKLKDSYPVSGWRVVTMSIRGILASTLLFFIAGCGFGIGFWSGMTISGVILSVIEYLQLVPLGDWSFYFVIGMAFLGIPIGSGIAVAAPLALLGLNRSSVPQERKRPNEGIHRTALYSLLIGSLIFLVVFFTSVLFFGVFLFIATDMTPLLLFLLVFSTIIALLGWFQYGGLTFIHHLMLRLFGVLWSYIPLRYVRFLNYATERIFLRRIGGNYIFVHRMLMEYFAGLEKSPVQQPASATLSGPVLPASAEISMLSSQQKEEPTMPFTHGHALIIGVGSYAHAPNHNVPMTAADAQAVARIIRDAQFCGYPAEQVTLLTGESATRAGILAALDQLTQTGKDDTVLLFYSGHGDYDSAGDYHLTSHDTRRQDGRVQPGTAVSQAELLEKLRAIPAGRVLLLFNACHAGEISPTLGEAAPPTGSPLPDKTANALLATGSGRVVITACRENQVAFVGPGDCTLFAQALTEGLRGGGEVYSRSGFISAFDLYTHLYYTLEKLVPDAVPQYVRDRYGNKQEPELTILKGVGPFAVALFRGATTLGSFPTDQEPDRETAVREIPESRSRRALQNITGTATVQGDNYGQNVGVNTGTMTQSNQTINNQSPNQGAQGNFHGPVTFNRDETTFNQQGQQVQGDQYNAARDIIRAKGNVNRVEGDYVGGDKVGGDKVAGDKISGDINVRGVSGSGIAIGHKGRNSVRNVNTGGGDYAEGNIDKRGAITNIRSKLDNVTQSIGAAPQGDAATKAQLQRLIEELSAELQRVPAGQTGEAEAVAETAKAAVEQATREQPNKTMVLISGEGLKQAAQNLATVLPTVLPPATQIADTLRKMVGA